MILIISSKFDTTTNIVINWLKEYKANFHCLYVEDFTSLSSFDLTFEKENIVLNNLDLSKIKVVWHRRGRIRNLPNELNNIFGISKYLKKEEDSLIKSIEYYLKTKCKYIGSYIKEVENYKLNNLIIAKECGLKIPSTIVTTSKKNLLNFFSKYSKIISKDLRYPCNIKISKDTSLVSIGTFVVNEKDIQPLDDNFSPMLIQEYIEKEFEIRVFYFENKLYPMAIFSQTDSKTSVDYRNYNNKNPNRNIPYLLPKKLSEKIYNFINKSVINTGSIDIIFTKKKEYVFLEVNPMGQLDWVSKKCNFHIEKDIAKKLIEYTC